MHLRRVISTAAALVITAGAAVGVTRATSAQADLTLFGCITATGSGGSESQEINHVGTTPPNCPAGSTPVSWQGVSVGGPPSPSPSATSTSPSPSPSPTPSQTTPPPPPLPGACSVTLGQNCGPYAYAGIPPSNGFDTYVGPQNVGANSGTIATTTVTDPGNWNVIADAVGPDGKLGYEGVQIFANVQQLFNDWCGSATNWSTCASPSDTPLDSLSTLAVTYSETSPTGSNDIYEYAPDIWSDGYNSDIMFWADTHGRCNNGAYGSTVLGTAVIDGQTWTVNRYGDFGAEIIFVLDSNPAVPDSCAQQASGTIDIKAGLDWLVAHGFIPGPEVISQVNTGWEITSAANSTFTVHSYGITVS